MNLDQASILNNFCDQNREILLVFTQANGSLSTYYKNKYGNISHKFKTCVRAKDLEPGLVWVSLQNFDNSYKDLLKYFHPDLYRGKRLDDELQQVIQSITSVKQSKQNHQEGDLHEFLSSLFTRSESEQVREEAKFSDYIELLGSRDYYKGMQNRIEGAGCYEIHKRNTAWLDDIIFS